MASYSYLFEFSEDDVKKLYTKVIGRKNQIDTILTLFGQREAFSFSAISSCGHIGTGKSFVVQTLLRDQFAEYGRTRRDLARAEPFFAACTACNVTDRLLHILPAEFRAY